MERDRSAVPARTETVRQALRDALQAGQKLSARELSQLLGAQEREILAHLAHLERSLRRSTERLSIEPARCLACSFEFDDRSRLTKPGRCPACRSTRISVPRFSIE